MTSRIRPAWSALPAALRADVERVLGARVEAATGMPGGWSPGSADRVVLEDGRRAFVKAASADVNAVSARLHRREAAVLAALTGSGAAPDLLGTADEGPWFALVAEDLAGRHPDPASAEDTEAVLAAVAALPDPVPPSVPAGEHLQAVLDDAAAGWLRLLDDGGASTVPGGTVAARRMAALATGAGALADGTALVHGDLRLDNALIAADGRARLIDWPWAGIGAAWFDGLTYLLDARRLAPRTGPPMLDHPLFAGLPDGALRTVVAALAGYFFDGARRPPEPGLEGVRAFQREQGLVLLEVLGGG